MKAILLSMLAICTAPVFPAQAQEDVRTVPLAQRTVVLSDLAVLPEHIIASRGGRAVAKFTRNSDFLELSEDRRRQLVRRQLPASEVQLRHSGTVRFKSAARPRAAVSRVCFGLIAPVDAGAFLDAANVEQVDCRFGAEKAPLRYVVEAGMVATVRRIEAGQYLGPVHIPSSSAVTAGTELTLLSMQGPVTVTRRVTTLQAVPQGSLVFVRTEDGEVLSALLSISQDQ